MDTGVKRPEREIEHPTPPSVEVMNAWGYTSTPSISLIAWCLIKQVIGYHGFVLT